MVPAKAGHFINFVPDEWTHCSKQCRRTKKSHHLIFCDVRVHTPFHSKHVFDIYIYIFEPFTVCVCFVWCEQHESVVRVYWRKHIMPHQRALLLLEIHSHRMKWNNLWCALCDIVHTLLRLGLPVLVVMLHCSLVLTSTHMLIDCAKRTRGQWPECAHSLSILLDNGQPNRTYFFEWDEEKNECHFTRFIHERNVPRRSSTFLTFSIRGKKKIATCIRW